MYTALIDYKQISNSGATLITVQFDQNIFTQHSFHYYMKKEKNVVGTLPVILDLLTSFANMAPHQVVRSH